jgi:3-deoxy-manno-octulosonate cytidylyltransferase (CMP-KDO synthetase)
MKAIIIIPARLESKRLNRKLLLPGPNDNPLLYYTWKQAKTSLIKDVYIATNSTEIYHEATKFGANVIMTKNDHDCGTSRIEEAYTKIDDTVDCIINLQGDEPEIRGQDINLLVEQFIKWNNEHTFKIATLAVPLHNFTQYSLPQNVKVVFDRDNNEAIYFSRSMIPWINDIHNNDLSKWKKDNSDPIAYKHIGIYAYTPSMLKEFTCSKASPLESIEGLEQMRAIEHTWPILIVPVKAPEDDHENIWPLGINTGLDYKLWKSRVQKHG